MPLTPPHIVIVVQLNGFISGSLLQQRPLYKPPMFHLDRNRTIILCIHAGLRMRYIMNMYSLQHMSSYSIILAAILLLPSEQVTGLL